MGRKRASLADRFWKKVQKSDHCWQWTASTAGKGYGYLWSADAGRCCYAHRLSWEMHIGPIPEGADVLHSCDNPRCVRPDHLFLGTNQDNVADRENKGRGNRGMRYNRNKRLRPEVVQKIREAHAAGTQMTKIAADFHLSKSGVSRIVNGNRRGNVG